MIVSLQVLSDGGAQEPELLHCCYNAVYDGQWGNCRGISPKVHYHLHCFGSDSTTQPFAQPYADLAQSWMGPMTVVTSANIRSFTEGSFKVQTFVYRDNSSGERTHP